MCHRVHNSSAKNMNIPGPICPIYILFGMDNSIGYSLLLNHVNSSDNHVYITAVVLAGKRLMLFRFGGSNNLLMWRFDFASRIVLAADHMVPVLIPFCTCRMLRFAFAPWAALAADHLDSRLYLPYAAVPWVHKHQVEPELSKPEFVNHVRTGAV